MTVLIAADLHLNDLARDNYRHNFMAKALPELVKKYKAEALVLLGDFTDDKDCHPSTLVNRTVDHICALAEETVVISLKGNHDYTDADNPFFRFLGRMPNIYWLNVPYDHQAFLETLFGDVLFLPHTPNWKRDWDCINLDRDLIFAHQTFEGANVGGRKMEGAPTNIFPDNSIVISGDIHVPQTFDQVTYCGSPYLVDFGDNFKPRILALDPVSLNLKSIPCPGPQKRLVEINSLAELKQQSMLSAGDILKVRVKISANEHAQWPAMKAEVKKWGDENGYNIYLIQPQVNKHTSIAAAKRRRANARSDEELMQAYSKTKMVDEQTLEVGLNLMEKA